jgi:hypothetical protein
MQVWPAPIEVKRAATHERGTDAPQFDAVASDEVVDGMIGSKLLSVDGGSQATGLRRHGV